MAALIWQEQELLGIFFKAFAFLHKHYEFHEGCLVDLIILLNNEVSDWFSKSDWVLMVNSHIDKLVQELRLHVLLVLSDVLD